MQEYDIRETVRNPKDIYDFLSLFLTPEQLSYKGGILYFKEIEDPYIVCSRKKIDKVLSYEKKRFYLNDQILIENVKSLSFDYKEVHSDIDDEMSYINTFLEMYGLKVVDYENFDDEYRYYMTKLDTKSQEEMVNGIFELRKLPYSYKDIYVKEKYPNKITIEEIKRLITSNLTEKTINYELTKELLEDLYPEFDFKLKHDKGKTYLEKIDPDEED